MAVENKRNSKKPSLKKFKEAAERCNGNKTKIAKCFGVLRVTVNEWTKRDPDFYAIIEEYKKRLFDECMESARILARGIPDIDPVTKKIIGWKEKPDAGMLKYYMSHLGKDEGFGESLDITTNGKDIKPSPVVIEVIDSREKIAAREVEETDEDNGE